MGWTFTRKPKHIKPGEFLKRNAMTWSDGSIVEILGEALVARSEWYALVKRTRPDGTIVDCFLATFMVKFVNDEFNMGWKDMTDTMGPNIDGCPERILDLADIHAPCTPEYDPNGWAKEWRARCRARIARRKSTKAGTRILFPNPVKFTDGSVYSEFVTGKGSRVYPVYDTGQVSPFAYRITRLAERDFTVVPSGA